LLQDRLLGLRGEHVRRQPDDRVGLWLDRSEQLVVAVWGILKAGAAYVPIDPDYPPERQRHMLSDSACRLVITEEKYAAQAVRAAAPAIVDIRCFPSGKPENPMPIAASGHLAYVIYTSGSTGKPKGVMIEHRSVVNFLFSMQREPGFLKDDVLLSVTTISFDIAVLELFLPLVSGGKVVIVSREMASDGTRLGDSIRESQATVMQATPTAWRLLVEADRNNVPRGQFLRPAAGQIEAGFPLGDSIVRSSQDRTVDQFDPDLRFLCRLDRAGGGAGRDDRNGLRRQRFVARGGLDHHSIGGQFDERPDGDLSVGGVRREFNAGNQRAGQHSS
jgi:non-ribosomal peptide synthetase component F